MVIDLELRVLPKSFNSAYFPDIGATLNSAIPLPLPMTLSSWTWNFYVEVLNSSYFPDHMMDWVYICCEDRYRSKVLFSNIPTPLSAHSLGSCSGELCCLMTALV